MLKSMTGFGRKEADIVGAGKVSVEFRSSNHKFFESIFHLPPQLLSLEEGVKKVLETKIKRGRVTCVINVVAGGVPSVFINRPLLKNYILALKKIKKQLQIEDDPSINTLIHLPGVLSLENNIYHEARLWPSLKILAQQALGKLEESRQKEGRALYAYLRMRAEALKTHLEVIQIRFKKIMKEKLTKIKTDEERAAFLKDKDITEEMERLVSHIRNFKTKLAQTGAIGKELDFIAQEMQREANTMAAKCCDVFISARVVQIKSQIEKIREQVQNIE